MLVLAGKFEIQQLHLSTAPSVPEGSTIVVVCCSKA